MAMNPPAMIAKYLARVVLISAAVAGLIFVAFARLPAPQPRLESWQSKAMYTVRWQVFSLFAMAVCVLVVALTRLFTPAVNPLNPEGVKYVATSTRVLQNTLEQLVLSVPAQIILSSYLESESLRIIPILVVVFVLGRLFFWLGYPLQRTYGFMMTFFPTIMVYLVDIFFFIKSGPAFRLSED